VVVRALVSLRDGIPLRRTKADRYCR
jgi:hypothetical protein